MINLKQIDCYEDTSRHRAMFCGRRGGKTYLILQTLIEAACESPEGAVTVYCGPSNPHAMGLLWEPLGEALIANGLKHKALISKQRYNLPGKRKIFIMGAENIDRIRGFKIYFFAGDEFAYWKRLMASWQRAIRPGLADYAGMGRFGGGSLWGTTPKGKDSEGYEFYSWVLEQEDWSVHSWYTIDNPYIDREEIEAARRELDEFSYRQEFEASWETFSTLCYYSYSDEVHKKPQPHPNFDLPLKACFDLSVDPTTLLVSQYDPKARINRFLKEYSINNSSTEDTVGLFCKDFDNHKKKIDLRIRGDASGRARSSTTGRSDYEYVHQVLTKSGYRYTHEVPASNPAIVDRLKYFNGWMKPVVGPHRVEVDPSCKELIKDLATQGVVGRLPNPANNSRQEEAATGYNRC